MAKTDYIPKDDEGKAAFFERFRDTLPTYAAALGLLPAEVAGQAADAAWFRHVLGYGRSMQDYASQWAVYKKLLLDGTGVAARPVTPAEPLPVPAVVAPGVVARFRRLARRIKAAPGYTEGMGRALGILCPERAAPDLETLAPRISLRLSGGRVELAWRKQGMPGVEIQKNTGQGWAYLGIGTRTRFTDKTPLPAPPEKWLYRAIYCDGSDRLGNWSATAEIAVGA